MMASEASDKPTNSDSFWELGNYKRTTHRVEDGYRLTKALKHLVKERAHIENAYAKNLQYWSDRWTHIFEAGPEYGTTKEAVKGMLKEGQNMGSLHLKVRNNLRTDIVRKIENWQKNTYTKSLLQIKQKQEMDDAFKNAQKPWEKLIEKMNTAKHEYYSACKEEHSAYIQKRNVITNTTQKGGQMRKILKRAQKSKYDLNVAKEKYEGAVKNVQSYICKYVDDMAIVFDKCQEMEMDRLQFFKEIMLDITKAVNVSDGPYLDKIYSDMLETIDKANDQEDLMWWSLNHGPHMVMNCPQFEEYSGNSAGDGKGKSMENDNSTPPLVHEPVEPAKEGDLNVSPLSHNSDKELTSGKEVSASQDREDHELGAGATGDDSSSLKEMNPFEDDIGEGAVGEMEDFFVLPQKTVVALYDYNEAEPDELSFKKGDIFEQLDEEDEMGWSTGRKDGRMGFFPVGFVKEIPN